MAISPLWPKPPRWPIQPGAVDPNQRWVWHTRPRLILPLWEHAGAGAAQRYRRIGRGARVWQLNAVAAAMRTRYGPGVSIPTTDGAEIESLGNAGPPASWAANEPYTIALLIKGRSGGAGTKHLYRSGSSSTADHILWLSSGTAEPAAPGERWWHGHHHLVRRDRERYHLVDDRRDLATRTPRAPRGRLVACLEHGGGDEHQRPVRHLSLWLGLLGLAGLQRRHRAHRVLRLILDPGHGATLARRSVRLPASMERGARALWQCTTLNAPFDRHGRGHLPDGVASHGLWLSKLSRDRLEGVHPELARSARSDRVPGFRVEEGLRTREQRRRSLSTTGAGMAVFQAVHALALFTGRAPDTQRMWQYFDSAGEAPGGQSGATET
jgi:hypothetical protein